MSGADDGNSARTDLLARDIAREKRVLWQGLLALVFVLLLVVARAWWWV